MKDVDFYTGEVVEEKEGSPSFGFDPVKDLHPVDPYGFIDLRSAYENHNVPTQVADEVANYNGIEDPESLLGTAKDVFEAYRMRDAIQKYESQKAEENGVSPDKGEN